MSVLDTQLPAPLTPEGAMGQAANRVTPFGEYLGAKWVEGGLGNRAVAAGQQALMPAPADYPTDEMRTFGPPGSTLPTTSPRLDKQAYEASPLARPGIVWDEGMTEARARALADKHDTDSYRASLVARYQGGLGSVAGFVAGSIPGLGDLSNFVPILGEGAKAAMIAGLGRKLAPTAATFLGHVGTMAGDAGLNTAGFEFTNAASARQMGQDFGASDAFLDILGNTLAGGIFGSLHGVGAARGEARAAATAPLAGGEAPREPAGLADSAGVAPAAPAGFTTADGARWLWEGGRARPDGTAPGHGAFSSADEDLFLPAADAARLSAAGKRPVLVKRGKDYLAGSMADDGTVSVADPTPLSASDTPTDGGTFVRAQAVKTAGDETYFSPSLREVGAVHGGPPETHPAVREALAKVGVKGLPRQADALNLAGAQLEAGEPVDVGPVLRGAPEMRAPERSEGGGPVGQPQPPPVSNDATAFTSAGRRVPVRYEVVEARDLTASHTDDMAPNPAFPPELQPRDRARAASETQIASMAGNLEPALLGRAAGAAEGAPIVGPDGVVESGNGRVLAIRRAYREGLPGADRYREFLAQQGHDVSGMEAPVLVRRRKGDLTPEDRAAFTREANVSGVATMGTAEQARADAAGLKPASLELLRSGDMYAAANRPFVRAFLGSLPEGERGGMLTAGGELSRSGGERLRNAVLAKAFGDPHLIARMAEEPESGLGALGKALADIAPEWAMMRAEAAAGHIAPEGDGTAGLLEALRAIIHSREAGNPPHFALSQSDMFGGGLSRDGAAFLRAVLAIDGKGGSRIVGRERLTAALERYLEGARKQPAGPDMFGGRPATPAEIIEGRRAAPDFAAAARPAAGSPRVDVESTPASEGGHNKVYTLRGGDGSELAKVKAWSGAGQVTVDWVGTPEATALHDAADAAGNPLEGGAYAAEKNHLGPRQMMMLAGEIARDNPDAKWLTGFRVSGARENVGEIGETAIDLDRFRRRAAPDFATAKPHEPHPSVAEAADRVGKNTPELETFAKDAGLDGYDKPLPGHEPPEVRAKLAEKAAKEAEKAKTGIEAPAPGPPPGEPDLPPELLDLEALRRAGELPEGADAILAAGEKEARQAEGWADAYAILSSCVLKAVE